MKPNLLMTNINSADPHRLFAFYRDVVGLEREPSSQDAFRVGGVLFAVDGHSDLDGPTREPARVLVSFTVDDLAAEERRLVAEGVPCIRSQGREFWGGVISTFLDPDGNYFQLMQAGPAGEDAPG